MSNCNASTTPANVAVGRAVTRRLVACGTASVVALGISAAPSAAAPTGGAETDTIRAVCEGSTVTVIQPAYGNSGWRVEEGGDASQTPNHIKELSVRVYSGSHVAEPETTPIWSFSQSYGERVGQGPTTNCLVTVESSASDGTTITTFFDIEATRF